MADKVQTGSKFRGSPLLSASTANNILDAAEEHAKRKRLGQGIEPHRKTLPTDMVRVRNDSGANRRGGDVMRVGDAIMDHEEGKLTNEFLWFKGLAPNTSEKFGILRKPLPEDKIGELQVSGVCKAWVNITDLSHERAKVTSGSHVLSSADTGQFKLLWTPGETGEKDCVVVFADRQGGASHALAKLTASMCPDDFCVDIECVAGECDAPTQATNLFKKKGRAGDCVYIAKIEQCEAAECEIELCEESGSSSGGSSWVIVEVTETPLDQLPGYSASKTQALKHDPVGDGLGSSSAGGCVGLSWIDILPCEEDSASDSGSGGGGGGEGLCAGWEYGNNGDPIGVYEWNGSIWDQVEGTGSFVCDGGTVWIEGSEAQCPLSREGSFVGETANGYCIHETS